MSRLRFAFGCMALSVLFASLTAVSAQEGGQGEKTDSSKETRKDGDKAKDEGGEKEEKEEEKWLDHEGMEELMEQIKEHWNKVKLNTRKKMGDKAADAADELVKLAPDVNRWEKKEAREDADYKKWVEALKENAEKFSKAARKGDWEAAGEAKEKIGETCGDCHDVWKEDDED